MCKKEICDSGALIMKIDWKYIFAVILGIAGLAATIWYANLPPAAKSLVLNILSKSSLSTIRESELPGLKIYVDEIQLQKPALTVLTLSNNGTTPVRSDDFEGDFEILIGNEANIIRTSVAKTTPEWLNPIVYLENSRIHIKPILLNPEDSITLNILSNGIPESISSRIRIAGVNGVPVVDSSTTKPNKINAYIMLIFSFFTAIPTMGLVLISGPIPPTIIIVRRRLTISLMMVSFMACVGLAMTSLEILGVNVFWKQMMFVYAIIFSSIPFAFWLNKFPSKSEESIEKT